MDEQQCTRALEDAHGAWTDRDVDGEDYVEHLRSGTRLDHVSSRWQSSLPH